MSENWHDCSKCGIAECRQDCHDCPEIALCQENARIRLALAALEVLDNEDDGGRSDRGIAAIDFLRLAREKVEKEGR